MMASSCPCGPPVSCPRANRPSPFAAFRFPPGHQPFSKLGELVQKGILDHLQYSDEGGHAQGWKAVITASSPSFGCIREEAFAPSKQEAKRSAARTLMSRVVKGV